MPAWSDQYGGPLRQDQIFNLAQFVLNWEATAVGDYDIPELSTPPPGPEEIEDPVARGRQVYLDNGCGGCHTVDGLSAGTIGPDQSKIGTTAATRIPGMSAENYILESITDPSVFVVDGYPDDVMPKIYSEISGLDDLVAFLLAQK
jgi:mono/diheme cytochrome c family protein